MHIAEFEAIQTSKMSTSKEYGPIMYDKPACVEPFTLINEVKKYQMLYNKNVPEYSNMPTKDKEKIWELIHAVLFPNYEALSEDIKTNIKITVRKRWKSLRDAAVKDHRLRSDNPECRNKKMSETVKAMQFIIPHIKYPLRKQTDTDSFDGKHSPDFCKLMMMNDSTIDLTYHEESEYVQIDDDDIMVRNEALYPSVHLTTNETEYDQEVEWKNGFCVSAPDAYNNNSTMNYTIREIGEEEPESEEFDDTKSCRKRRRTDSEDDLHLKLNELIDRCNEDSHDEDRMFLLSLLSDFKRVPVHKKLKVKSAFVTALSEALD